MRAHFYILNLYAADCPGSLAVGWGRIPGVRGKLGSHMEIGIIGACVNELALHSGFWYLGSIPLPLSTSLHLVAYTPHVSVNKARSVRSSREACINGVAELTRSFSLLPFRAPVPYLWEQGQGHEGCGCYSGWLAPTDSRGVKPAASARKGCPP